ncbi:shikimate dehydrogenase [Uliginosibacterium sp. sgz301328]|uniref:shikimate dehydrogenase n=1 Tax=Uliginosibacterium sp. sgz301328 TaxID=3243764 RepID=UPI00359D74CE
MTDRYAVIGNPIAQSKSPLLQMAFARQTGQDMSYISLLGPLDGFVPTVREFQRAGGRGMNVTMPFKLEAFALADELTPRARAAGAVNTLVFRADGSVLGDNTDGIGIVRDISINLARPLEGARVLIVGAGGAVRGTLLPVLAAKPRQVFIANRTAARAAELAAAFADDADGVQLEGGAFDEARGHFDIIINGSASSMSDDLPPLLPEVWDASTLAYDMAYKSEPTPFMRHARECGVRECSDGLGMLVEQGAESFFLWRGVRPDTAPVIAALRVA